MGIPLFNDKEEGVSYEVLVTLIFKSPLRAVAGQYASWYLRGFKEIRIWHGEEMVL